MLNARRIAVEIRKPIFFLEHPVGSGKTEAVLRDIAARPAESFIYVCPTLDLSNEIEARLNELARNGVFALNTQTLPRRERSVVKWAGDEIKKKSREQHFVFVITTQTFLDLLPKLDAWTKGMYHVFIDEGLEPVRPGSFRSKQIGLFSEYFEIGADGKFLIARGHRGDIEDLLENPKALEGKGLQHLHAKAFKEICELVYEPTYDVFGKVTDNAIEVIGFLNPEGLMGFASTTFIVAIFSQSALAMCLRQLHKVELQPLILDFPFFDTHAEKGPSVEIFHVLNAADSASKAVLGKLVEDEAGNKVSVDEAVARTSAEYLDGMDYCWTTNREFFNSMGKFLGKNDMPFKCHGLNAFKACSSVAMLGSANPVPWQNALLCEKLGLEADELFELWNLSPVYQAVGRCAIRNRGYAGDISIIVLGKREALRLHQIFEGSKFRGQLGNLPRLGKHDQDFRYDASDNTAYSKYRKRQRTAGKPVLSKDDWYKENRIPQKDKAERKAPKG